MKEKLIDFGLAVVLFAIAGWTSPPSGIGSCGEMLARISRSMDRTIYGGF